MLVFIESYLVNLQSLGVVFGIQVAQAEDAGGRLLHAKHVEVQQHHLAVQFCQRTGMTAHIGQLQFNQTGSLHLRGGLCGHHLTGSLLTGIVHAFQRGVMQMFGTL